MTVKYLTNLKEFWICFNFFQNLQRVEMIVVLVNVDLDISKFPILASYKKEK